MFVTIDLMNSSKPTAGPVRQYPYFPLMLLIHTTSALLDASVAVILAASALFAVDVNEAKVSILLSLFATMIPFIALAPTASLLVEKIKVPRIVLALSINAFRLAGLILMAVAASQSSTSRLAIFPLAFVMLTLSKCYSVIKTSTLPQITTVESFPYFSSRLAMTTGIVGLVSGSFLFALNRIFSESVTLYFSSSLVFIGIVLAVVSYARLGHKVQEHEMDTDFDDKPDKNLGEIEHHFLELSKRNQIRAVKSLFTFVSSTRLIVGLITIGVALEFRSSTFMLGVCFVVTSLASFVMNAFAVAVNKTRFGSVFVYICALAMIIVSVVLIVSNGRISYVVFCATLGALGAYTKVVYESRIAHLVPQDLNTTIFSRGEVIMQLTWVVGAVLAVISFERYFLGAVTIMAIGLSVWAYRSNIQVLKKTNERF